MRDSCLLQLLKPLSANLFSKHKEFTMVISYYLSSYGCSIDGANFMVSRAWSRGLYLVLFSLLGQRLALLLRNGLLLSGDNLLSHVGRCSSVLLHLLVDLLDVFPHVLVCLRIFTQDTILANFVPRHILVSIVCLVSPWVFVAWPSLSAYPHWYIRLRAPLHITDSAFSELLLSESINILPRLKVDVLSRLEVADLRKFQVACLKAEIAVSLSEAIVLVNQFTSYAVGCSKRLVIGHNTFLHRDSLLGVTVFLPVLVQYLLIGQLNWLHVLSSMPLQSICPSIQLVFCRHP